MYEVDALKVGNLDHADAMTARFTDPITGSVRHIIVDAGWQADGDRVVEMIREHYGAPDVVDLVIVTHPDGDHIGGMATVLEELNVTELLIHRIDERGGSQLPAAKAVSDLVGLAHDRRTRVTEPTPGLQRFGHAVTILGPSDTYYDELVQDEVAEHLSKTVRKESALAEAARSLGDRFLSHLPLELPFSDWPGSNPRNNSSIITLLQLDGFRAVLTGDAGVPALEQALDYADQVGLPAFQPNLVKVPHHGSRRNGSSALLNRLLGPPMANPVGNCYVSVANDTDPKHPSGRIMNAYANRGFLNFWTLGVGPSLLWQSSDLPQRSGYGPATPLPPFAEEDDA